MAVGVYRCKKELIQNLKAAGCCEETIDCFIKELDSGNLEQGMMRLAAHRKELLENMHREQKCIDCLDYLVYEMEHRKE